MFDQEDNMSDSDGDTNDLSDVEENGAANSGSESPSSRISSEDEAESTSSTGEKAGSDTPDSELIAFNAKLAQALGTRPAEQDLNSDESSASDQDMNDEQMEAIDGHLEEVFRQRKKVASKKTERKEARVMIVNFKCRVLELLDIYVKERCADTLALSLLLPVLTLIRKSRNKAIMDRASAVIRQYAKHCRGSRLAKADDPHEVFAILKGIHREAGMEGSKAHCTACGIASLLVVRILINQDGEQLGLVSELYENTRKKILSSPDLKVKEAFFVPWQGWYESAKKYSKS